MTDIGRTASPYLLISRNYPGNLHQASHCVNNDDLVDELFAIDTTGTNSVAIFKVDTRIKNLYPKWVQDQIENRGRG